MFVNFKPNKFSTFAANFYPCPSFQTSHSWINLLPRSSSFIYSHIRIVLLYIHSIIK